jgi:dihydroorotase-like cyclic amidohydrolase
MKIVGPVNIVNSNVTNKGNWATGIKSDLRLYGTSTSGTAVTLTTDAAAAGATNQLILPNDSSVVFRAQMIARNTATDNDTMAFEFIGAIRRGTTAANTAIIGTPSKTIVGTDGSAWTYALTADTTNGGLKIAVTGAAAKNIDWTCFIDYTGVTG